MHQVWTMTILYFNKYNCFEGGDIVETTIKEIREKMKDVTIIDNPVTVKSTVKETQRESLVALADKIAEDMGIGKEAHTADGTVRTNKNGEAVIVKVSVDLVARWFIANQAKASEYSKKAEPAKAVEAKATKAA